MYHHIQTDEIASAGNYKYLSVKPDIFQSQMAYLQAHNYHPIAMGQLINFFDSGTPLPSKPVFLTFDDGYADFVDNAAPILSSFNFPSTLFVPTGLLENPGYTTWGKLAGLNSNLFYFANHTWSHKSSYGDLKTETFEITTADTQLKDHHMNSSLVFAYPYGPSSTNDKTVLAGLGYKLAFTTVHGSYLCKDQRYDLPRIRIGNTTLSAYGL
jgi:peptidoglycan/xylan/chitin deacetylase (PgdA/CDA1 family)